MMKHKEYLSLQRQVLSMEWIVVILKNSSLFLEPTVLKAILESFFPTQARFNGDYFNGNMSDLLNILMQNDPNHVSHRFLIHP